MLIVTDLSGQTEMLTDYQSMQRIQRVNEEYSLSFLLPLTERNEHAYPLVQEESYLEYDSQTYIVKELEEKSAGMKAIKSVKAFHVYLCELDDFLEGVIGGNVTIQEAISFVLQGKNFTFEIPDSFETKTVINFGNKNRLALVQDIFKIFGCEIEPHNRHLIFKKQIGQRRDFQFRFRHNIKTVYRHVDTTNLKTAIRGYGANGLVVTYRSSMVDIYGERWAEPITDEEISDETAMLEKLKNSLHDEPNISLKLDAVVLPGEVGLGDEVYTIYEPIGIDILQRVVEYIDFPEQPKSPQVTIANFRDSLADVFLSVVNNVKEVEKQTSLARSEIKQTNDQIQLTVTKTEELNGRLTTAESQITQQADQISLKVSKDGVISAINQSPEQITISASKINLTGAVTISSLASDVRTTLDSKQDDSGVVSIINGTVTADYVNALGITARWVSADNLLGSRLYIGKNGVSQTTYLEMWTGDNGAHYIKSNQASGFRIESTGSLSLVAGSGYGIYTSGAPLVCQSGFRVDSGSVQFNSDVTVNATLNASYLTQQGLPVATQNWVWSQGFLTGGGAVDSGNSSGAWYRWAYNTSSYYRLNSSGAAVVVNGSVKATWSSMPKVRLEPAGDGVLDGREFGANNPASMQPVLFDFFFGISVDGEKRVELDGKFMEFVSSYDVFISSGSNVSVKEKGNDYIILQGNGVVSFFVAGVQQGKEDIVGYTFIEKQDGEDVIREFTERIVVRR